MSPSITWCLTNKEICQKNILYLTRTFLLNKNILVKNSLVKIEVLILLFYWRKSERSGYFCHCICAKLSSHYINKFKTINNLIILILINIINKPKTMKKNYSWTQWFQTFLLNKAKGEECPCQNEFVFLLSSRASRFFSTQSHAYGWVLLTSTFFHHCVIHLYDG